MTPSRAPLLTRARNLERIRQISEVAVRHGFGYFFERHNLWQALRLRRRDAEPAPRQRARHIREMFEELGPTFVKFGQLLSTRPDVVPPDMIEELVKLQDQVAGFAFETAREVIEEDLGLTLERLFVGFDPVPIAAASIGQVHRAVLPGGRPVVVKVQRPDAAAQIHRDIDLLYQVAELMHDRFQGRIFVDPVQVVDEFSHSIRRELDYLLEGRNAERFRADFADDDAVTIPKVYWRYSTRRVLTLEHLEGISLNEIRPETLDLVERRQLVDTLADCWFKQILVHGFFHGDPHPANILYRGSGRIALLDFGITGLLTPDDLEQGTRLFLGVLDQDFRAIKRTLRHLGVEWGADKDRQLSQTLEDAFARYYGTRLGEVDPAAFLHEVFDIVYTLHLELPTRFLMLDKALLTIEGVVTQIYPDFNVFDAARPYARSLVQRRFAPRRLADRVQQSVAGYRDLLEDYPVQLHAIFDKVRRGEIEIQFRHRGLEDLTHRLDVITNRAVVALVAVSMGVSSAFIAVLIQEGPQVFGLSLWGLPGLVAAFFFGIWLMYGIFRSGRL